jgi:hypothetical protein
VPYKKNTSRNTSGDRSYKSGDKEPDHHQHICFDVAGAYHSYRLLAIAEKEACLAKSDPLTKYTTNSLFLLNLIT